MTASTSSSARTGRQLSARAAALLAVLLIALSPTAVSAVDRSKFRTCGQTSFCRRHRGLHSAKLYSYQVLPETVRFHPFAGGAGGDGSDGADGGASAGAAAAGGGSGLWKSVGSVMSRALGTGGGEESGGSGKVDPHFRGPAPSLTATLVNTVAEPSSGELEKLEMSIHLHEDGVARMRITEQYGTDGAKYEKARWTSDELILNQDEMKGVEKSELFGPDSIISAAAVSTELEATSESDIWDVDAAKSQSKGIIEPLLQTLPDPSTEKWENYIALRYGGGNTVLIRLKSFAMHLFREGDMKPAVSVGDGGMMHFEVRRAKEAGAEGNDDANSDALPDDNDAVEEEEGETEEGEGAEEEEKKEKEVVGYWEDGLAIYSDGTREERKVEGEAEAEHRKLLEEQSPDLDREGMWEESFSSHHDSKPNGPMSVGLDITFPSSRHIFGLPEHASSLVLQTTHGEGAKYNDPYRLYNLDVFEYELDETMALYGHIPLVISQSKDGGTAGAFMFNPSETFVDVYDDAQPTKDQKLEVVPKGSASGTTGGMRTHWMAESGVLDLFLLPGRTAPDLYKQYARLTGYASLPPMFSLGYHQCRWNYRDEPDVYAVHSKFEELDYPYDVLWLDIEHTDGKRYFTWDSNTFPNPKEMQEKLWSQGRRMVTIIDPHIKRDDKYRIHKEATAKGLYIKDKEGKKDYDGWCWPGSSSYLDFTSDRVRSWWAHQFAYDKYVGSTPSLFTWNDMNEPSVFNGPEVSMSKDLLNLDGVEHREWHNLYGLLFQRATAGGLIRRNTPDKNVRPFVLSRSFFAGSQRYGAIWTGDNLAEWSHLEVAAPMLLSMNSAALTFVGADVGGFFGNPDAELMTRWMQAGAYTPFFRGHAHHDAKRREPWMFGEEWTPRMRRAAMERYALLPFWYTVFWTASVTGMPTMRPMWMQYPKAESLFATDDQYLVGSDLLVKPVTAPGVDRTTVSFPAADSWYDARTHRRVASSSNDDGGVTQVEVTCPIDAGVPVYQRGGSVVPRKLRLRRSSELMKADPYTLYVALDADGKASGELYMDDEVSFDHERKKNYGVARFSCDVGAGGSIKNKAELGSGWWFEGAKTEDLKKGRMVERIVVMGMEKVPKDIVLGGSGSKIEFEHDAKSQVLVIRKPEVSALEDWEMKVVA
uniref:Glucosidase II subunit alpha n=1 Tax=Odontella aurita TaxID=265563 RepID=A0A7S4K6T3_9STRA|mmetsp:Transcript_63046/g.186228  ORF Transcript_63046/g.186228 Transcript_63046/m.186228 type:complete len:1157 (+) Transcript_63046:242-3712(+)